LTETREKLGVAKKVLAAGKSPAKEKSLDKAQEKTSESFDSWGQSWLKGYQMADSTRDMRQSVYDRDFKAKSGRLRLTEITDEDLCALTATIVRRPLPCMYVKLSCRSSDGQLSLARKSKTLLT